MYEYITLYKRVRRYRSKLEIPDGWEDYAGAPISFTDHKVYLTEDREIGDKLCQS